MLDDFRTGLSELMEDVTGFVKGFVKEHPVGSAIGTGASALGAGLAVSTLVRKKTKKKTYRRRTKNRRIKRRSRKRKLTARQRYVRKIRKRPGRQSPYTAGARRDRSTKRIRYTKNGQPYVIMRSGKARFIKKSSAKRSRKLKGGRY